MTQLLEALLRIKVNNRNYRGKCWPHISCLCRYTYPILSTCFKYFIFFIHRRSRRGQKKHTCSGCGETFTTRNHLTEHRRENEGCYSLQNDSHIAPVNGSTISEADSVPDIKEGDIQTVSWTQTIHYCLF